MVIKRIFENTLHVMKVALCRNRKKPVLSTKTLNKNFSIQIYKNILAFLIFLYILAQISKPPPNISGIF
jgi:hypothetical protein